MEIIETDVLVVGSGAAGMRAAIEANENKVQVTIVTKGILGKSGCTQGALYSSAVGPWHVPGDSKDLHFRDTVVGGGFLCNQKLARILVDEAPDRLIELEEWGMYWERNPDGTIKLIKTEGHSFPRTLHINIRGSGLEIAKTLRREILQRNIEVYQDTIVTKLLTHNGQVVGATALNYAKGNFMVFRAKSIVLATGSGSQIYRDATHVARECTGDGYVLAYRVGAELVDMEQTMWTGACFVFPWAWRSTSVPVTFKVENYHPYLINRYGERFMKKYDPVHMETATKDVVARAIFTEIKEGRGPVYADLRHIPYELLLQRQPDFMKRLLKTKIDIRNDMIEVSPDVHTMSGGIRINEKAESTVPGLYAAGCVAGGVHGGNRIGGSGTIDALVFGRRAGFYSAERAKEKSLPPINRNQIEREYDRVFKPLEKAGEGISPVKVRQKIREQMWNNVGISKKENEMLEALMTFSKIKREYLPKLAPVTDTTRFNMEWVEVLEVINMIDLAEIITKASIARKETRNNFIREDYPERDDKNWLCNIVIKFTDGQMKLWTEPVKFYYLSPEGVN